MANSMVRLPQSRRHNNKQNRKIKQNPRNKTRRTKTSTRRHTIQSKTRHDPTIHIR